MNHFATPEYWFHYRALPENIRALADRSFQFMKSNPRHPSLHLKQVGDYWSVRVGIHHRALGVGAEGGISWFWVGTHAEYDQLVG